MNLYWLDIKHPLNGSRFWKHEWEKHGTCAAKLDALDSKYFGKSLVLYKQIDLTRVLQKFVIEPSINSTEPGELLSPKQEVWLTKVAATQSMMVCEDEPVFYPPPKETKY
ncbi:Ribonuclease T2 [Heterocephalus glaber]|uniref:Ribonuclease T2 n=1 Tax=Heterocephalus glaber TaxID=10181 RepID=G5C7S8_HETGA|nr:Ribonuclease T2 [Heterocephalus glaber]